MTAGVREYWMVDPKRKKIIVYLFNEEEDYDIFLFSFEDEVPVNIFGGECKVDFKEIYEYISFLFEI